MTPDPKGIEPKTRKRGILFWYSQTVRMLAIGLMVVSGTAIFAMMTLVCLDVLLRTFGHPISGSIDLVKMMGAVILACALPYTTAVKGHVAIEYFFHKLGRLGRIVIDTFSRLIVISLFLVLSWQSIKKGLSMLRTGEVSNTLELPTFWVLFVIAFSCFVVSLVVVDHLLHPNKEMIKP
jgi:TRAP-type C4-dicarboxylate transport system permease small subunit